MKSLGFSTSQTLYMHKKRCDTLKMTENKLKIDSLRIQSKATLKANYVIVA